MKEMTFKDLLFIIMCFGWCSCVFSQCADSHPITAIPFSSEYTDGIKKGSFLSFGSEFENCASTQSLFTSYRDLNQRRRKADYAILGGVVVSFGVAGLAYISDWNRTTTAVVGVLPLLTGFSIPISYEFRLQRAREEILAIYNGEDGYLKKPDAIDGICLGAVPGGIGIFYVW